MEEGDRVDDGETIYRSVAPGQIAWSDGEPHVSSSAFLDPYFKPSVDRAPLCVNGPDQTQRSPADGVCQLVARRVRAISPAKVGDRDALGHVLQERTVDVVPDAVPENDERGRPSNPAHALIVTTPQISKKTSAWSRVREALAFVAGETPWAIVPTRGDPPSQTH